MATIYALDWGEKRWGLANCQMEFGICMPQPAILGPNHFEKLFRVLEEEKCSWVVIGYPLNMNGSPGKNCPKIDKIKRQLESKKIKVDLWDERMSSELADQNLKDQGLKGKKKKKNLDSQAALMILEEFLRNQK